MWEMFRGNRRGDTGHPSDSAAFSRCNAHIFLSPALNFSCCCSLVFARFPSRASSAVAASDGPRLQLPTHRLDEAAARNGARRVQRMAKVPRGARWFRPLERCDPSKRQLREAMLQLLPTGSVRCSRLLVSCLALAFSLEGLWFGCGMRCDCGLGSSAPAQPVRGSDGPEHPQRADPAETSAAASEPPALGTGGRRCCFEAAERGREAERR